MPTSSHVHGNRSESKYESAGESGAGKTFTTQKILDFLAEVPVTACSPVSAPAHAQTETGRRKSLKGKLRLLRRPAFQQPLNCLAGCWQAGRDPAGNPDDEKITDLMLSATPILEGACT